MYALPFCSFVLFPSWRARIGGSGSGLEVFGQEGGRPLIRQVGRVFVIMRTADAGEGMIATGIEIDGGPVDFRQRIADLELGFRRYELVLLGDMGEIGSRDGARLVQVLLDPDAII